MYLIDKDLNGNVTQKTSLGVVNTYIYTNTHTLLKFINYTTIII